MWTKHLPFSDDLFQSRCRQIARISGVCLAYEETTRLIVPIQESVGQI
ncbi:hypothetical protein NEIMUCOT_04327 [Neisseria mucosa ATCC 25996]|uniref:Uncharacterized protein n=1 Tax=Neisseria mucosa (strain ATCC 25996 / DSM 4631 / NCTC 10774 / M26) TaxID=546266 RepID=D2ZUN7_NEIM2|nr:hypothetical protein NEIMUCOT_04327 [Neisseria mucosa ATCC 25996]